MREYTQSLPPNPTHDLNSQRRPDIQSSNLLGYLIVLVPIFVLFSILGYKRYKVNRRRRRIEMLERIWKVDANRKTY